MIDASALDEKPVLTGERIRLVPLGVRHAAAYHAATEDPEIRRLTGSHREFTPAEIGAWCAGAVTRTGRLDLAVEDRESGRFLGDIALLDVDPDNAHATLRIMLVAGATDRGLGSEAVRLLLGHAFDRVQLHRVQLEVWDFNHRARRAYERCGFTLEGRMRQALRWDGAWHDVLVMAALRTEWTDGAGRADATG
ncbi:GNAT family N-acetyltransferase [Streptomyces catenulae]|uniref:GNAT family protein n=1 Tax=Streptomyces catenulae TaxID=66875 RepID=A0ABV2YYR9_9ACTN|nr:GNAT family protein [Streptomyces catenulae]